MTDKNRTEVPTAWLIRAGSNGEREDFVLGHGLAFGGWDDLPDLSGVLSRGEMKGILRWLLPAKSKMSVANYSGQLWALRAHVSIGDLVVLPRKKTRQIAIGVVIRAYWYRNDPDPSRRHVVSVDWKRTDVPWEAAHEDLRNSLSSLRTIGAIKCDDGAQRLREMMTTGRDPGTSGIDAAKFAMALAINAGANSDERDLTVEGATTKWNVGSFDPDSQLRSLIDALYPDVDQPYRLLEFLIDDGLRRVSEHMESVGELDVIALLDEAGTPS